MRKPMTIPGVFRKFFFYLSRPAVPFCILPGLMIVLIAGTVAQRYIGLYAAQKIFFSSFIVWFGPLPLPGGVTLLALLTLSLFLKFIFYSPWPRRRLGINLVHMGILVLLTGGLLTALYSQEGAMIIPEGESSKTVLDYHRRELVILKDNEILQKISYNDLAQKRLHDSLPFRLDVLSVCRNCKILRRDEAGPEKGYETEAYRGMAQFMALRKTPPELNDEENLYGITLKIAELSPAQNGIYVVFDPMPETIRLETATDHFEIAYGKEQRRLPFSLKLADFIREDHPGTDLARRYSSLIMLQDNESEWPVLVEMNKPLRYGGYTFFQSSFVQTPDGQETSILTVVKNRSWLFPYIGAVLIGAGLLFHFGIAITGRSPLP